VNPARSSPWTVGAVAVLAYAACDLAHEILGHGIACALSANVRAISISTVALQTDSSSRMVAVAGTIANVVVGVLALLSFRRRRGFGPMSFFLWLFAALNFLNATGYLLFSSVLDLGDWAVVIAGFDPHWAWRVLLGAVGLASYVGVIRLMATQMVERVDDGGLARGELPRLVILAYVAGGLLLVAGSALNPVGPQLILLSGVSSGFGAMAGLTVIPALVERRTTASASAGPSLPFSLGWVGCAWLVALVFVGILGPGVRLS